MIHPIWNFVRAGERTNWRKHTGTHTKRTNSSAHILSRFLVMTEGPSEIEPHTSVHSKTRCGEKKSLRLRPGQHRKRKDTRTKANTLKRDEKVCAGWLLPYVNQGASRAACERRVVRIRVSSSKGPRGPRESTLFHIKLEATFQLRSWV